MRECADNVTRVKKTIFLNPKMISIEIFVGYILFLIYKKSQTSMPWMCNNTLN